MIIDKTFVVQERENAIQDIKSYGYNDSQIQDILAKPCNYIDLESNSWDIILFNLAICELLWYHNLCKELGLLKTVAKRRLVFNQSERLPEIDETRQKNLFFSTMVSIVQKYGLDEKVSNTVA